MGAFSTSVIRLLTARAASVRSVYQRLHAELVAAGVDALGDRRLEVRDLVAQGRELAGASAWMGMKPAPSSARNSSSSDAVRATPTAVAPAARNAAAMPRPKPLPAPVTIAVLPVRSTVDIM
jgi:hypothetical protein